MAAGVVVGAAVVVAAAVVVSAAGVVVGAAVEAAPPGAGVVAKRAALCASRPAFIDINN